MHVYFIGGHGKGAISTDPGACANSQQEWKVVRELMSRVAIYLKQLKVNVTLYNNQYVLTKTKDMFQQTYIGKGLWDFTVNDRLVFEWHLNSSKDKTSNGTELIISTGLKPDKYDIAVNKALGKYFKQRGIKQRDDLLTINVAAYRGINYRLIETCFISNKDDINKLIKNMDNIARDLAEAISGKSLAPKKASEAIGKAYFMRKDKKECWLYIYPWDIMVRKVNNWDRYAHEMDIHTKGRAIYSTATGKRVNTWKGDVKGELYYIDTATENKVTRQ